MKKLMLICAPVSSRSGYGDHARDLVYSFCKSGKFDIKILDVRWGECPRNALDPLDEKHRIIIECLLPSMQLDRQPDVFQPVGKFNIGITAGIETNAVSQAWLDGCNKMDLIIVPSEHSKGGFVKTAYDKINNLPDGQQQTVGQLKLEKPMEVVFEGSDEDIYKPLTVDEIDIDFFDMLNEKVTEKFAFLSVGQWGKGNYGEDRKDIGKMIKIFYESFANKQKKPGLLLKTNGATYSIMDKSECIKKINDIKSMFPKDWDLPNVYLLHGDLNKEEMNKLYNHPKVKSMVSFTHGEGFGRPLLESTMVGLPVIASNWSGQCDFLDTKNSLLLSGKLVQVPKSAVWKDIIIDESQWFSIDESDAYKSLNYSFQEYDDVNNKAKHLMKQNVEKFSLNKMTEKLNEILEKYVDSSPTQVDLNLPKLKKVSKSEPPKIKLPKLKRV